MSEESEKAIEEIIAYLERLGKENFYPLGDKAFYPEKLPFIERLKCYWDLKSQIKSVWLTGYILITFEWDYNFLQTLEMRFYKGGSYE